jgi:hypothetical protein
MKKNRQSSYIALFISFILIASLFLYDRIVAYKELVQIGRINVEFSDLSQLQKQASFKEIQRIGRIIRIEETIAVVVIVISIIFIIKLLRKIQGTDL